jgi:hypothetical protein
MKRRDLYIPLFQIVFLLAFMMQPGFTYALSNDLNEPALKENTFREIPYNHDQHDPLDALRDPTLRNFIKNMLVTNYKEARLFPTVNEKMIDTVLTTLETFNDPIEAARYVNAHVMDFVSRNGIFRQAEKNIPVEYGVLWKREFIFAASFMSGVVYDCGCGNGVRALAGRKIPGIKRVIMSDQFDWRTERVKRISAARKNVDFYLHDGNKIPVKQIGAETVNTTKLNSVIHHIYPEHQNPYTTENRGLIIEWLKDHHTVLQEGGRLLVWEDAYPETSRFPVDRKDLGGEQAELNTAFDQLSRVQKYKYLAWNDYYWNILYSGEYEMPMAYRYYTIEEWNDLFREAGFVVKEAQYWGFVKNRIHGAASAFFVLEKKAEAVQQNQTGDSSF